MRKNMRLLIAFLMLFSFKPVTGQTWIEVANSLPTPQELSINGRFGYAISMDGDYAVIGAPYTNNNDGVAYVLYYDGSSWVKQGVLTAGSSASRFGMSVGISGDVIVVGSADERAIVFEKPVGGWTDLSSYINLTNGSSYGAFAEFVDISGDVIVIGNGYDSENGTYAGAAFIYEKQGASWTSTNTASAKLLPSDGDGYDDFGEGVSIDGDHVVVGAKRMNNGEGGAYVFTEPVSGWADMTETAKLIASDISSSASFGYSVSISGDFIVASSFVGYSSPGAAYVFEKPVSGWINATEIAKLTASDGDSGDGFAISVSISGDDIVVGASSDDDGAEDSGVVFAYTKPVSGWVSATEDAKLQASDGAAFDYLGRAVSVANGRALTSSIVKSNTGEVYSFVKPAGNWTSTTENQKVIPNSILGNNNDGYGESVAMDGSYAVIAAPGTNVREGMIFVLFYNGSTWVKQAELTTSDGDLGDYLGVSVSISGNTIVAGANLSDDSNFPLGYGRAKGAAYVFEKPVAGWSNMTETAKLTASDGANYDEFGLSVKIFNNEIVVGAKGDDDGASTSGSAYVFVKPVSGWIDATEDAKLTASDPTSYAYLGQSVSIDNGVIVLGAPRSVNSSIVSGAAYVYIKPVSGWVDATETAKLTASNGVDSDRFGEAVDIHSDQIIVGASWYGNYEGMAYVFQKPTSGGWVSSQETAILTSSDGTSDDRFGHAVAIFNDYVAIGAADEYGGGAVYIYEKPVTGWTSITELDKIQTTEMSGGNRFGNSVDINDDFALVGKGDAWFRDILGGSYLFEKVLCTPTTSAFSVSECSSYTVPSGDETYTVSGVVMDTIPNACGADSVMTITIVMEDVIAPVVTAPANLTIECDADSSPANTGVATAIDNCDAAPAITFVDATAAGSCLQESVITRTWTATDADGNASMAVQTITIEDSTPPVITAPANVVVECDGDSSPGNTGIATALDNCDATPVMTFVDVTAPGSCPQASVISRTWTSTDACGNASSAVQTITIEDATPPVITAPADLTIQCDADSSPANTGSGTGTDNCDAVPAVTFTDAVAAGACPQESTISRTWTATDACGNTSMAVQVITVIDTQAPSITAPVDLTIQCDADSSPANTGSGTGTDNCDAAPVVTFTDAVTAGACPQESTISRTWTATDACGNASMAVQVITVIDTQAPSITAPADVTIECDEDNSPANTGMATTTDNCDAAPAVTFVDATAVGSCPQESTITRTWTATDACGNASTAVQIITVQDTQTPVTTCSADVSLTTDLGVCGASSTALIPATAIDNCGTVTISSDAPAILSVGVTNVTWTATDECGNASTCVQVVTVVDNELPIISCPTDIIVSNDAGVCEAVVTFADATATDNCSVTVVQTNGLASGSIFPVGPSTVEYTATDASGNVAVCSFTVTVNDDEAPILPTLADVTAECSATVATPTTTDNCAGIVTGTTTDPTTYNTEGIYVITWTFDDGNGNPSTQTQNVIIDDISEPLVVNVLSLITDECSVTLTAPTTNDACVGVVTGTTTTTFPITTQGTTIVDWSYDDGNGNVAMQTQTVVIDDVTSPVADLASLIDITGSCQVATLTAPTATDNCAGAITATSNTTLPITTLGTTVVTWIYDDGNGNITTQDQNVILTDLDAPVADVTTLPNVESECSVGLTAPTATDACEGITVNGTTTDPLSYTAQGTYTVTWTYTDGSGNTSMQTQTVIVNDVSAPVANNTTLADLTGLCQVNALSPAATDNCSGQVIGTTTTVFPITSSTTITWSYDDGNGNVSTQTQNIVISGVDVSTTLATNGVTITANNANAGTYQWIDCDNGNAVIGAATDQSYTPTENGSYAVIINEDGCIDTSACVMVGSTGIDELNLNEISIYPNPTINGEFTISVNGDVEKVELIDLFGRIIPVSYSQIDGKVDVSQVEREKYFVRVQLTDGQVFVKPIVIMY